MSAFGTFSFTDEALVQIANSPDMRATLLAVCERIKSEAESLARAEIKDDRPAIGKRYADSFDIGVARSGGSYLEGTVTNDSYDAVWVEKGARAGGKTPVLGLHILERAMGNVEGSL